MKNRGFRAVKWLLAAYLFVTVALPLAPARPTKEEPQ